MEALKIASYPILALFVIMVLLCVGGCVECELLEYITLALMPVSGGKNREVSLGVMLSSWIALEMELKNAPLYDFAYILEQKLNEVYLIEKGVVL